MKTEDKTANQSGLIDQTPAPHFIIIYESIYKNDDLSSDELMLLIKLLSLAPTFKPNYKVLAWKTGLSERAIIKASHGLQEKGYLKIENKHNKNGATWIIDQQATFKPFDYTAYFEDVSKGKRADLKEIKDLYKKGLITLKQRDDLFNEIIRIARTGWLDE